MEKLGIMISIGAFVGWITNFIAIKMLFSPQNKIGIGFFSFQGVIPKRKHDLACGIAETIEKEFFSMEDIKSRLNPEEMEESLRNMIEKILDNKLKSIISVNFPIIGGFLNDKIMEKIKISITNMIIENKKEIVNNLMSILEEKVDIKSIIIEKIDNLPLENVEKVVYSLASKELKFIEIIGGLLGALIGTLQFIIMQKL